MRLIDADALVRRYVGTTVFVTEDEIENAPAVDAAPFSWLKEHLPVTVYRDLMDAWGREP